MDYKKEFVKFMCDSGVLTFGEFTLKSGRKAPYFVNTGNYRTGRQIAKLGEFYAACIEQHGLNPQVVFGPAYKGIPLCIAAASAPGAPSLRLDFTDRMERGKGDLSAVQEVDRDFGLKVYSIVTIQDIIDALREGAVPGGEYLDKMLKYREEYGV